MALITEILVLRIVGSFIYQLRIEYIPSVAINLLSDFS